MKMRLIVGMVLAMAGTSTGSPGTVYQEDFEAGTPGDVHCNGWARGIVIADGIDKTNKTKGDRLLFGGITACVRGCYDGTGPVDGAGT